LQPLLHGRSKFKYLSYGFVLSAIVEGGWGAGGIRGEPGDEFAKASEGEGEGL